MTAGEKLRLQDSASQAGTSLTIDPQRLPLTKLALDILALDVEVRRDRQVELASWLKRNTSNTLRQIPFKLGRVAAVSAFAKPKIYRQFAADLLGRSILLGRGSANESHQIYQAGAFSHQRFVTDLDRNLTNYIGESLVDDRGSLQYLKVYGLSATQTRRAYLLQQLDA